MTENKFSFPLYRAIPSIITVCALCTGATGIFFAINGQFPNALTSIMIAAILDTLDGRMARLLKVGSDFGAILDSLADFSSFGIAPSIIIYLWSLYNLKGFGWVMSLFFPVCCALRLARFNTSISKTNSNSVAFSTNNYFHGVPAPAGAGLCLLPIIIELAWHLPINTYSYGITIWVFFVGILSVSTIPTFSFKKVRITFRWTIPLIGSIALSIAFAVNHPWIALCILLISYLVSILFSAHRYHKLEKQLTKKTINKKDTKQTINT